MEKTAKIDPQTVLRFGLGGAATGASLAALLSLVHQVNLERQRRREAKKEREPGGVITLTLPKSLKTAAEKRANWQTLVAGLLAGGAGGAAGYKLVSALYHKALMNRFKQQEEAARQELLDQLANPQLKAGMLDFPDELMKEAQDRFGHLESIPAALVLMYLLGAGGTAYLTKKFLDEKFQPPKGSPEVPQIKKIVFKSQGALPKRANEEALDEAEVDSVKAAFCIEIDKLGGTDYLFTDPGIQAELEKAGLEAGNLAKMDDIGRLIAELKNAPGVRTQLQRVIMGAHPIMRYFKWAPGKPILGNITDQLLYSKLRGMRPKTAADEDRPADKEERKEKQAIGTGDIIPHPAAILASYVGSEAASRGGSAPVSEEAVRPKPTEEDVRQALQQLQIVASDEEAEQYLKENRARLAQILAQMAREGKL